MKKALVAILFILPLLVFGKAVVKGNPKYKKIFVVTIKPTMVQALTPTPTPFAEVYFQVTKNMVMDGTTQGESVGATWAETKDYVVDVPISDLKNWVNYAKIAANPTPTPTPEIRE
jgi:hypothetical protein